MIVEAIRWLVATLLGLVWTILAAYNGPALVRALRGRGMPLVFPLVGGTAGCLGMVVCPFPGSTRWAWIPFVLDSGCPPLVALVKWVGLSKKLRDKHRSR